MENKVKQTLAKNILADGFDLIVDLEKSKGSWIFDSLTNSYYLDMFSMFGSASIGYNHDYLVEKQAWLGKIAINKPTLSDIYTQEYADFLEVFVRVVMPKELQYCFFIAGGTLAVENAMKACFDWKTKKNFQKNINKEAGICIHFKQAFHGRSGYSLSLTNTADPRKYQYFPKFDWPRIINPKLNFPLNENSIKNTIEQEKLAISQINNAIKEYENQIACIIIEPIQAEGGDNHFREEFLIELRNICNKNEILLIFDEVQTGICLTGKMWAYQNFNVIPDAISFGKKAQVCGFLANKQKFDEIPNNVFKESSRLNSTFGGDLCDMMRFKLIMEVIEKENLCENSVKIGKILLDGLENLHYKYPDKIFNPRGKGLMCAIDLENTNKRDLFRNEMFKKKIIILGCGEKSIRFRPHLNVKESEIIKTLETLEQIIIDI